MGEASLKIVGMPWTCSMGMQVLYLHFLVALWFTEHNKCMHLYDLNLNAIDYLNF